MMTPQAPTPSPQNNIHNFGSYSRTMSSQEANRIPVAISQSSTTTGSSMAVVEEAPVGLDFHRNQSRFQEFIARSRHMEVMEVLHDVKKRLIALEQQVSVQHELSTQNIHGVNREASMNTNTITEGLSKIYTNNANYLKELTNCVQDCKEEIHQLHVEVQQKSITCSKRQYDTHEKEDEDEGDEGVPLKEYLSYRKTEVMSRKRGIEVQEKSRTAVESRLVVIESKQERPLSRLEPLLGDYPDFDPLVCTQFDGNIQDMHEYEDTYAVDSFMTNPIFLK
jgi:hypothetical protein